MQPHRNWYKKHQDQMSRSDRVADKVTAFAGTMHFIYVHFVWWIGWFIVNSNLLHLTFDKYPYNLLTMILSLEAILLATLIMISQNRQSARDKVQAEHQFEHQEKELIANTELTKEINELTKQIHASIIKKS
jgi:uncharacterized membrane protein